MLLCFCSGDLLFIFHIKNYHYQTSCLSYLFTVLVRLCQFALIAHGSLVFIVSYMGVDVCKLATFFYAIRRFPDAAGHLRSPLPVNCQGAADPVTSGTQYRQGRVWLSGLPSGSSKLLCQFWISNCPKLFFAVKLLFGQVNKIPLWISVCIEVWLYPS